MAEESVASPLTPKGRRKCRREDLPAIFEEMQEGRSLRSLCIARGINPSSAHDLIESDDALKDHYARTREVQAEFHEDQVLSIARAAALGQSIPVNGKETTVDVNGARVLIDAVKWAAGRMAPKAGPVQRVAHSFEEGDVIENRKRLADLLAKRQAEAAAAGEPIPEE